MEYTQVQARDLEVGDIIHMHGTHNTVSKIKKTTASVAVHFSAGTMRFSAFETVTIVAEQECYTITYTAEDGSPQYRTFDEYMNANYVMNDMQHYRREKERRSGATLPPLNIMLHTHHGETAQKAFVAYYKSVNRDAKYYEIYRLECEMHRTGEGIIAAQLNRDEKQYRISKKEDKAAEDRFISAVSELSDDEREEYTEFRKKRNR